MDEAPATPDTESLKGVTQVIYALMALAFLVGISAIAAIVMVYIKRDDARDSWLESHYRWLARTFWFGLLWAVLGFITFFILVGWAILFANAVWLIYRIAKGWLDLNDGKPMYR
jgi:uncharacterized membrane protein